MTNSNSEKSHSAPPKSPQSVTDETRKKLTLSWTAVPPSSERGLIPRDNPEPRGNKNNLQEPCVKKTVKKTITSIQQNKMRKWR
jgi:hypothetical protein